MEAQKDNVKYENQDMKHQSGHVLQVNDNTGDETEVRISPICITSGLIPFDEKVDYWQQFHPSQLSCDRIFLQHERSNVRCHVLEHHYDKEDLLFLRKQLNHLADQAADRSDGENVFSAYYDIWNEEIDFITDLIGDRIESEHQYEMDFEGAY